MASEHWIDDPPAGADAWRKVWEEDRRYRADDGARNRFIRRVLRAPLHPEAVRQSNFNISVIDLLGDIRREIEAARRDLRADIETVQRGVEAGDQKLAADIGSTRELVGIAARRNDALISALDQKIETLAVRIRDAVNPSAVTPKMSDDLLYRRLEDSLRGSGQQVLEDVVPYVEYARGHQPLLDAGCGRGELLDACRAAGITSRGVDLNERSVADLRARGIEATVGGIPECFAGVADASLGSVAALHVVEHLPVEALFALFREAARVLRAGGLLMLETPNAESMLVSATEFWRDPTHLAPRHPAALTVLGREHGFAIEDIRAVHPFPEGTRIVVREEDEPGVRRVIDAINDRLFAPQDLRLVLRRA